MASPARRSRSRSNSRNRSSGTAFLPAGASAFLSRRVVELFGLALIVLAGAGVAAMITYTASDPSWNTASSGAAIGNALGPAGAIAADLVLQSLGAAGFAAALLLLVWGWR
ncbi:MAG: cell division protein FtsK, partial [Inquilinus sp.]|nr:cell division protein FtsK [Inquilinus sp.]